MIYPIFLIVLLTLPSVITKDIRNKKLDSYLLSNDFNTVISSGIYNMNLIQSVKEDQARLEIEGEKDTAYHLRLGLEDLGSGGTFLKIFGVGLNVTAITLNLYFSSPLKRFTHIGSGDIHFSGLGQEPFRTRKFILDHYGSGNVNMTLDADYFEGNLFGSGDYMFSGTVNTIATLKANGEAFIQTSKFNAKKIDIVAKGKSQWVVEANDGLEINADDQSIIDYKSLSNIKPKISKNGNAQVNEMS